MMSQTLRVRDCDALLDLCSCIKTAMKGRDRRFELAFERGLTACECCGKGLENPDTAVIVHFEEAVGGNAQALLGPECARKISKLLAKSILE